MTDPYSVPSGHFSPAPTNTHSSLTLRQHHKSSRTQFGLLCGTQEIRKKQNNDTIFI